MYFFDLHCDTVTEANQQGRGLANAELQLSVDRLPGAVWTQCFAIFMPDHLRGRAAVDYYEDNFHFFCRQLQKYADRMAQARTVREISAANAAGRLAAVLTVEGGSALAGELSRVRRLRECGVRMLTLTWNGANELAGGTAADPMAQGFTPFGRKAVAALEDAGIIVDVSHLSDKAFWELSDFARRSFVASHSNLRSVCDHPRNLTDDQFRRIVELGGLVGVNFYIRFLAPEGEPSFDGLAAHIERMLLLGGEDAVALGSDFDGADMPLWLASVGWIPQLYERLCRRFGNGITEKLFYRNAMRFFARYEQMEICW
ncbi:dipeptidase [Anaerotruncus rubiinfantis]|uniref:dipeptidase n=1 Tax=Anaerotruncus rubiinfantis TaxID=1720200 RepID=UPI00164D7F86|nr:membrane dipeptidase [Anaerotruncus rubiinfantis]